MASLDELVTYCNDRTRLTAYTDAPGAKNGLQVANRGTVTRIGNTSRTVRFEARKVIASRYDLGPSAADVLAEPIVTCRAIGATVIPREHSRKAVPGAEAAG